MAGTAGPATSTYQPINLSGRALGGPCHVATIRQLPERGERGKRLSIYHAILLQASSANTRHENHSRVGA